ncbi:MAG: LCP family protein [Lachnospiraceae bacterium]|nr:LCP family protein [Lachnospiraceae bacterium]
MTFKKARAGLSAMLLYSQLLLLFMVVDTAIVKGAELSKVTAPLALQEAALMLILAVIIFVGYYLVPVAKAQTVYIGALGAVEILFWLFSAVMMGVKKILGTQEILFVVMECVLIAACCAGLCILSPKKEKGNWTSVRVVETVCAVALFGSATYVAVQYHNELISAGINIVMFGLCAACMLLFWWFTDSVNHLASVVVVIGQAIVFLYCFSSLCRRKESVDLFSGAYKIIRGNEPTHFLTWIAVALAFFLALAMLLHYLKNLQIIGKYVSIILSCFCLVLVLAAAGIQKTVGDSMGVNPDEVVKYTDYSVIVRDDDPAQAGADIAGYTVGYSSEGRTQSMSNALKALEEKIGSNYQLVEYPSIAEALDALVAGEVNAVFGDAETINIGLEFLEEFEGGALTSRVVETVQIEFIDEVVEPWNPDDPGGDDPEPTDEPEDSPTPTLPEGVTATPTPTLPAGVTATPTPTKKPKNTATPGATKTPTPTTMPKKARKDKSGMDLTKESFVIYISGIDRYGDVSVRSRSDVNLIMAVNPKTKKISIVTTPRDAYVHIPGVTSSQKDKLTHAGLYGVDYSMATLENLYGIEIDFYIRLNFSSMIKLIDMIGGVDAESFYEYTTINGAYHFPKGWVHLDGTTALVFARERKGVSGGDSARAKHQMEIIKGIIRKLSSASILSNYQSLLDGFSSCTQTDITLSQFVSLATMQLGDGAKWSLDSYSTSGDSSYQYCYSYKGKKLWVSLLKQDSIKKAADLIKKTLN